MSTQHKTPRQTRMEMEGDEQGEPLFPVEATETPEDNGNAETPEDNGNAETHRDNWQPDVPLESLSFPDESEFKKMLADANAADAAGRLHEVTSQYLKFDDWRKDEKRAFFFMGMDTFTKEGGEVIPAAKLQSQDGTNYITAAIVVTGSLIKIAKFPCVVFIQYFGKKKGGNGTYNDIKVFTV